MQGVACFPGTTGKKRCRGLCGWRYVTRMDIETAVRSLLNQVTPVPEREQVSLYHAAGRILAEDVRAPFAVPHFPKSAMDGYAIRSEDVQGATPEHPVRLKVVGELLAGDDPAVCLKDSLYGQSPDGGTAVRIMTGAAVPEGYDAVVKQEDTDYGEAVVTVRQGVSAYTNYCKVGEDIPEGSVVLTAGRRIGRIEAGVLASLGIAEVTVVRPIRVSILSTGSELFSLSEPDQGAGNEKKKGIAAPAAGRIYNSIAYTLSAGLAGAGFTVTAGICPDDTEEILRRLEEALKTSDIVITTGGVSVGKKDLLPEVLERAGAEQIFAGVDVQPGTPTIGSVKNGKVILSLSGNPYAALVNFDLYFWEVAAKLTGCEALLPVREEVILGSEYPKKNRHRRLLRAKVTGNKVFLPAKSHASSVLSNLLDCNCYIDLPAGQEVAVGERVRILRMPGN